MNVRQATISDADAIHTLISHYAELDRMLPRSLTDIYENLQQFHIAEDEKGATVGCWGLQIIWSDLAEIKSLAVQPGCTGMGTGKALVEAALNKAKQLGVGKVFTLTLEPHFFEKMGFTLVEKDTLPMKVWSDCAKCSKQQNCDETALLYKAKDG